MQLWTTTGKIILSEANPRLHLKILVWDMGERIFFKRSHVLTPYAMNVINNLVVIFKVPSLWVANSCILLFLKRHVRQVEIFDIPE